MAKEMEREAWTKVIYLLKELSYMYDKKHKEYYNRHMRQAAYKALLQVYNEEIGRDTTLAHFKKKLENMRTTYAREWKKVNASMQTGSGSSDVYIPTLWYYSLFSFLEGTMEPIRIETDPLEEASETENNSGSSELEEQQQEEDVPAVPTKTPPTKKQKITIKKEQKMMLDSAQALLRAQKEDDWVIIGKSIGIQMRDLSTYQQVIVQKIISDAIFYGKLGKLTEESHITLSL